MSDRGSILISTANDIGEALVEKLGGEGYAPSVWDKEYNKLGIAEVDADPALSVLEDSSETGTARGSILLSTANAIGAMLNKKYNTDRGFKPKEWASACRKMKPLETDTKSGSVVNIQGAKETPLLSLVATISPTSSGISSLTETQTGKTVFLPMDIEQGTISGSGYNSDSAARIRTAERKAVSPSTLYKIKVNSEVQIYEVHEYADLTGSSTHLTVNASEYTFTTKSTTNYLRILFRYSNNATIRPSAITELQVTDGALCWNTYTADLGRTVYGGTADFVNGAGTETYTKVKLSDLTWTQGTAGGREYYNAVIATAETTNTHDIVTDMTYSGMVTVANMTDKSIAKWQQSVRIYDTDISSVSQLLETYGDEYIVYPNRYTNDFTFDAQEISTSGDVENYYTSAGDTSIEYYAVPTAYTRGTASGVIANVQSARTDLPFTMVKANIAPSLTGVESVEVTKCGVNLFDKAKATIGKYMNVSGQEATNEAKAHSALLPLKPSTTYYMSGHADNSYYSILALDKDMNVLSTWYGGASKTEAFTATTPNNARWCYLNFNADQIDTMMFAESSSPVSYVEYNENVYTADLGEPVYGGYADLVSGEGVKTFGIVDLGTLNYTLRSNVGMQSNGVSSLIKNPPDIYTKTDAIAEGYTADTWQAVVNGGTSSGLFGVSGGYICFSTTEADPDAFKTSMSGKYLVYPLATQEDFTFDGQVISPSEGVNNLWNNAGGDTDVEYFEQE